MSEERNWNHPPYVDDEGQLHYGPYWDSGGMIINRECLDPDHPEYLYNYLKRHGITPEHYGLALEVSPSAMSKYGSMSKEELINLCWAQRKELEAMYRAGF